MFMLLCKTLGVSMTKTNKGRKPLPKGVAKCKNINIRVTISEHAKIEKISRQQGRSITEWCKRMIFGDYK